MKFKINNLKSKITNFVKKNKVEIIILAIIFLIGAFCRLYKIDQYMTFLGDEGRDVIIVRRIFTEAHPPLIGPGTSVGSMYLGPLYYYMMAIPLLVSGFSPVGPAVMVALISLATIVFIWWVGRSWFSKTSGIIAAGLYAISPTVITFSHSSWNPNIMPFFAMLSVYSIWKVWQKKEFNWLIILGVSFAFVLQSHYLGLLLAPTLLLFWILTIVSLKSKGKFLRKSLFGLLSFVVLMSPLLIFDLRHNFMNTKAFYNFIVNRDITISGNVWTSLLKVPQIFDLLNKSLLSGKNAVVAVISSAFIAAGIVYVYVKNYIKSKNFKIKPEYWLIFSWLGFGIIGLAAYKMEIYDHYLGFLFPVPFILIGIFISKLIKGSLITKILGIAAIVGLVIVSLLQNPFRSEPNRMLKRSQDVAAKILSLAEGRSFDLAVIAETNYEDGYRYFLELWGGKVLHADRWNPSTIAETLFVVCEKDPDKCDPTHSPKAEVANFGMSVIEDEWNVDGVIIYKLGHSK